MRAAHRLQQYGWPSKVYEASGRIGGRMFSNSEYFSDGRTVEWGGELISAEHTSLRSLAHQLNLELGRRLVAVRGDVAGPYTLWFSDKSRAVCDQLVFAMPYHLIREVDIDVDIWAAFREQKRAAIEKIKPADNGKIQLELASRCYDMVGLVSGEPVSLSAVSYSGPGTRKAPGFIATWEGNPKSPSERGIVVNYTGGYAGEALRRANPIPDALAPYFGEAAAADVERVLADFDKIWPGISGEYTGKALVSNWWDYPYSRDAFVSPDIGAMTSWWGGQWEREGNIHFAGEACDPEHWSYMDGAIRSGEAAAKAVAQA